MDVQDVATIAEASSDRFRLEALPTYLVPEEAEDLAAWRRGSRELLTPETSGWLANVRDSSSRGVRWSRVRVLDYPLSEYSEYELHGYQANAAAGERVFVADRAWSAELADLQDFWMFDETVIRMVYAADGHFVRPELVEDQAEVARCRAMRAASLRHSIPLADYLAVHEPRLIA